MGLHHPLCSSPWSIWFFSFAEISLSYFWDQFLSSPTLCAFPKFFGLLQSLCFIKDISEFIWKVLLKAFLGLGCWQSFHKCWEKWHFIVYYYTKFSSCNITYFLAHKSYGSGIWVAFRACYLKILGAQGYNQVVSQSWVKDQTGGWGGVHTQRCQQG